QTRPEFAGINRRSTGSNRSATERHGQLSFISGEVLLCGFFFLAPVRSTLPRRARSRDPCTARRCRGRVPAGSAAPSGSFEGPARETGQSLRQHLSRAQNNAPTTGRRSSLTVCIGRSWEFAQLEPGAKENSPFSV